jgi:tetratricopeptide (TPR) repeat protein
LSILFLFLSAVAANAGPPSGQLVEGLSCASDPSQTYTLYLPSNYRTDSKWPVLLVFDPRGRSKVAAEIFVDAAEAYGWIILSSNDTRSDTEMEPNLRAINALVPEIRDRFSMDHRRVYAAGFSGTVYAALLLARETSGITGVIASGGRFIPAVLDGAVPAVFGAVGDTDFNYSEMRRLSEHLDGAGYPNRLEVFEGPHAWMPAALGRQAVEWMELQAMKADLRTLDKELVARLFAGDMAAARDLAASDRKLDALRRYRAIVASFDGIHAVDEPRGLAEELAQDPSVRKSTREEKRWNDFEERYLERFGTALRSFLDSPAPSSEKSLVRELEIEDLLRRSRHDGWEGVTARRLLAKVYSNTSFYLTRDLMRDGRYQHAATALRVAVRIRENDPITWYNLACSLARTGRRGESLDALDRAVQCGFGDADHIESDPDLESLRGSRRFRDLLARLR